MTNPTHMKKMGTHFCNLKEAAEDILLITKGMPEEDFFLNKQAKLAVSMCFVLIGESITQIDKESKKILRSTGLEIPWDVLKENKDSIIGLRNRTAHNYYSLNHHTVWDIIKNDIPEIPFAVIQIAHAVPELAMRIQAVQAARSLDDKKTLDEIMGINREEEITEKGKT